MEDYDPRSCNALQKPYYRPIEAALRWCGLNAHESLILQINGESLFPQPSDFPQWPCLRANAEKIYDAIVNGDLPKGRDGRPVPPSEQVARGRLTIRHTDLKAWMAQHYPDQKPAFLFDEVEQSTHSAINADSFRSLQADRDALRAELKIASAWADEMLAKKAALEAECNAMRLMAERGSEPAARAEVTYLNIIGAIVDVLQRKTPAGQPMSRFESQSAIIDSLLAHFPGKPGISKTTLESRFAEARRSLNSS